MSHRPEETSRDPEDYRKQIRAVLREAVEDLRKTKNSYKCKEVARVRRRLEETLKNL